MINLSVDSKDKSINIELMLKGETEKLIVTVSKYQITEIDGKTFINIDSLSTNREWLNIVIETYLKDKRVEIPEKFVPLLEIAL
jgi:hypothetical protein